MEMNLKQSEIYRRPSGARFLVGVTMVSMCKRRYTEHLLALNVKSTKDGSGSSVLSAKNCKACENVGEI